MPRADAARTYVRSGLLFWLGLRAYFVAYAVRVVVELDLTALQLVLLGTALELSVLISEVPTGVVADALSRKWSVVISFLIVGVGMFSSAFVESFGWLLVTQVIWGLGWTFQSGAETAWITSELGSPGATEPLIVRRAKLQLLASMLGIAVGAGIGQLMSLSTVMASAGVLLFVWGVYLARWMPETGFSREEGSPIANAKRLLVAGIAVVRQTSALRILVVAILVAGLAEEAVDRLDVLRLVEAGLDTNAAVVIGFVAAFEALMGAAALWRIEHRVAGQGAVAVYSTIYLVSAVFVVLLALAPAWAVGGVAIVIQGGIRQAAVPAVTVWANAHIEESTRATVHSFVGQFEALGEIGGGIALGTVAALTSVPTALLSSAGLMVVAAAVAWRGRAVWVIRNT